MTEAARGGGECALSSRGGEANRRALLAAIPSDALIFPLQQDGITIVRGSWHLAFRQADVDCAWLRPWLDPSRDVLLPISSAKGTSCPAVGRK